MMARVFSQSELTLPFLETVYQSSYINPAALPEHKLSIGLPGISSIKLGVTNTGFTINQALKKTDTALIVSMNQIIGQLKNKNFLFAGTSVDLFHIRVKAKSTFLSFHINENVNVRFAYPKDFVEFPWKGNGEYIGEKIDWSGLAFDATHYREYALGFQRYDEKKPLAFGGRLKFLQGLSNVNWKNKELSLETAEDMYRLNVNSDGVLNTSLPVVISDDSTYTTLGEGREVQDYLMNFRNKGFAFDLGGDYQYNHRIVISAALSNIGFIKWNYNPYNYQIKGGTYFEGVDPFSDLYEDSTSADKYIDSIAKSFEYTKTQQGYTTWLPPRLYISGRYKFPTKTEIGLGIFMEKYQKIRPGFTLALNQKAGKWFEGVVTYSVQYRSFNNIGIGLMVKPGPVQFYLAADNVFSRWTATTVDESTVTLPMNARFLNIRFGINLVFAKIRTPEKQPLPEELKK